MTTTPTGRDAEDSAAVYLRANGYGIVSKNWRTRWCEIDIIATKQNKVYFVEVKYRQSAQWGDGLDAITAKKLQQMSFAAELWVSQELWRGEYVLAVVSASGKPPHVDTFIEL